MYWHAEKQNGEVIVLTESEALIHFEKNNISQRMRLRFLGTSSGKAQVEARKQIGKLIDSFRPSDYAQNKKEEQNVINSSIRDEHTDEIKVIIEEATRLELEEAKANGVIRPDASLHYHTPDASGLARKKILNEM